MSNPAEPLERWEYTILMLTADPSKQQAFFDQYAAEQQVLPYDYRALIPQLDELGADGWELVTLMPARMSEDGNMLMGGGNWTMWSYTYLCTFKRRVR